MIIDRILDRKDGVMYSPSDLYEYVVKDDGGVITENIAIALEVGNNRDVQNALCAYIVANDYNEEICAYINSTMWVE